MVTVNTEAILLYWGIGRDILRKQEQEGWGAKGIARLSRDRRAAFPQMQGVSRTDLLSIRAFAAAWPDAQIVQRPVGRIPWRRDIALRDKLKDAETRLWYAEKASRNGWSQPVLVHQIETRLHERQGKAVTNFDRVKPRIDRPLPERIQIRPILSAFVPFRGAALNSAFASSCGYSGKNQRPLA